MWWRILFGILLIPTSFPAQAGDAKWRESPQLFLANSGPRGEFSYKKGDEILRVPLVWAVSARIDSPVTFEFLGKRETIAAGTVLPAVIFNPDGPAEEGDILFCTRSRVVDRIKSGAGLFAMLQKILPDSLRDSQKCLKDSDNDGKFDSTLMIGEGPGGFRPGQSIEPVNFSVLNNEPISSGSDDEVRLTIFSLGKKEAKIRLTLVQRGKERSFHSMDSGRFTVYQYTAIDFKNHLNMRRNIFGAEFLLTGFDLQAKTITIKWPENVAKDVEVVIPFDVIM